MTATTLKHEWRKHEKAIYMPKAKPELVTIPAFKYLTLCGEGSPDTQLFSDVISALYSLAYGIKMTAKKPGFAPEGHYDYTVYPLEGIWDINDEAKKNFNGTVNRDDFVYKLMLRQPDFVTDEYYRQIFDQVKAKKPQPLHDQVQFETIDEGPCVQMLHVGPYADEPATFAEMEAFAADQGIERHSKLHREIYLSDFRRTAPERLKTVLRFKAIV
ncbi:MAG: GyrI-like domain-containing protein [Opitutaceae bacterium]